MNPPGERFFHQVVCSGMLPCTPVHQPVLTDVRQAAWEMSLGCLCGRPMTDTHPVNGASGVLTRLVQSSERWWVLDEYYSMFQDDLSPYKHAEIHINIYEDITDIRTTLKSEFYLIFNGWFCTLQLFMWICNIKKKKFLAEWFNAKKNSCHIYFKPSFWVPNIILNLTVVLFWPDL